jgi:hypothetical protein
MPAIDRIEHLSGHSMSLRLWLLEHGVFEGSNDRLGQSPICTDHSSSKFIVNSLARYVLRLLPSTLYSLEKASPLLRCVGG